MSNKSGQKKDRDGVSIEKGEERREVRRKVE